MRGSESVSTIVIIVATSFLIVDVNREFVIPIIIVIRLIIEIINWTKEPWMI